MGSRENHDKKTASLPPLHGGCNSIPRKLKTEVQTMRLLRTDDQVALQRSEIGKPDRSPSMSPLQTPTVLPRSLRPVGHDIRRVQDTIARAAPADPIHYDLAWLSMHGCRAAGSADVCGWTMTQIPAMLPLSATMWTGHVDDTRRYTHIPADVDLLQLRTICSRPKKDKPDRR